MNDSELDRLLHTWTDPEVREDTFRRGVWQRIAQKESEPAPWWQRFLDSLTRPRPAAAALTAVLLCGSIAGALHAGFAADADSPAIAGPGYYLRSIDPVQKSIAGQQK